jgi:ABC-type transport system substrate-binding protein
MSTAKVAATKVKAISIIVIIIAIAIIGGLYFSSAPPHISLSVSTSTSVGTAGTPIAFNVVPSVPSATVSNVTWNFGDGSFQASESNTTHVYENGGRYLILVQATVTSQSFLRSFTTTATNGVALYSLLVQPYLTPDQAQEGSIPIISFRPTLNPTAPVFNVGEEVHPIGDFSELPASSNWTIQQYNWNFGNGEKQVVSANSSSLPSQDVTTSYMDSGIYPLSLTINTTSSLGAVLSLTTVRTVAIQSSTLPFSLLTSSAAVVNPGVIVEASIEPGGPTTFDPQLCDDEVSTEVINNLFQTLVLYNESSSSTYIPDLAATLPTQQNGGISPDFQTYTFQIRNNQYFSNGDPVTAYDVWWNFARGIAFAYGTPGTLSWVLDQFLVGYPNNTWSVAVSAVTYDNASNTVTLHLNAPLAPALLFGAIAGLGNAATGITDPVYAESVGAGFNQANWVDYENQANAGSYNTQMQWGSVGSGPYMVGLYTPGQSVELVPNPHYGGVPGIPKVNDTAIINWVKTPDTALLMLQDGQADLIGGIGLPPSDLPSVQHLQSRGLVNIYNWPTMSYDWFTFTIQVDKALEATQFGSGFTEPANYFADLPTRFVFVDSFDYQGYLSNILGNGKYDANFGSGYAGVIPPGSSYYVPPDQLGGLPTQNLNAAKGNFSISAWHDSKITVPIVVPLGDPVTLAAAEEWGQTLSQISGGNITAKVVTFLHSSILGNCAAGANGMAVYYENWNPPSYPHPTNWWNGELQQGSYFPAANGWTTSNFASLPPPNPNGLVQVNGSMYTQAQVWKWLNGNITLGDTSVDPAVIQRAYTTVQLLEIALGLYVNVILINQFWYFRSWLNGYQAEENAMYNGAGGITFFWLTKG